MTIQLVSRNRVYWQGALIDVKLRKAEGSDAIGVAEGTYWAGFAPPLHIHHRESEGFFVLEGNMKVRVGDREFVARTGDFVFGPQGTPHGFKVLDGGCKMLIVVTPAGFEEMYLEGGLLVDEVGERPVQQFDMERLAYLMRKYGIEPVGPPLR